MIATTLTQYLTDADRGAEDDGFIRVVKAVTAAVKTLEVSVSRGCLIVAAGRNDNGAKRVCLNGEYANDDYRSQLRKLTTDIIFEQVSGLEELAAVSIAGRTEIDQISVGGKIVLLVDTIHGLHNLDDNLPVGMTFSIYAIEPKSEAITERDLCRPGSAQVCAGISLFGPRTHVVLTIGRGVQEFTLDRERGAFVLTRNDIRIPEQARAIAINPAESHLWPPFVRRFVEESLVSGDYSPEDRYRVQWSASAVADFYRMLSSGGVFFVPDTGRDDTWLVSYLYVAAPLGLLTQQAGGLALLGTQSLLDFVPNNVSAGVPMYIGDQDEVRRLAEYMIEHEQGLDGEANYPLFKRRGLFIE